MRLARRIGLLLILVLVVFGLLAGWQAYQVRNDLSAAEDAVNRLDAGLRGDDVASRDRAAKDLTDNAASAADRTGGVVWSLVGRAPVFGDDAQAVAAISRSLDTLAQGAVQPLLVTVDSVDGLTGGGSIDVDKLESIKDPVRTAHQSAVEARTEVEDLDSDDYVGAVSRRVDEYVDRLDELIGGLGSGERALQVLPGILGANGPRNYLLVFQNNAEIRATGGIPGSWAQIHTDNGRLRIVKQGSSLDFVRVVGPSGEQVLEELPITDQEKLVYSELLGKYWQDATFTPNWQRASELLTQRWEHQFAPARLDGVISLDPVAMSYLLNGTGPIPVGDVTLDSGNLVDQLLSQPYVRLDADQQDLFFQEAARSVFNAVTGDLAAPLELIKGLRRAVDERRFLVTLDDAKETKALDGAGISGVLSTDDGEEPRVVVALNDGTASKMSYYLRYDAAVEATSCEGGVQSLTGNVNLSQTITANDATALPEVVTGPGDIGIPLGSQLVVVRIYGPTGGSISDLTVAGQAFPVESVELDGRPVATVIAQLSGPETTSITWTMETGPGQTRDGQVQVTPGIEPVSEDSSWLSAC